MEPNPYEAPKEPSANPKRLSVANEVRLLGYILLGLLIYAALDILLFRLCYGGRTESPLP